MNPFTETNGAGTHKSTCTICQDFVQIAEWTRKRNRWLFAPWQALHQEDSESEATILHLFRTCFTIGKEECSSLPCQRTKFQQDSFKLV